MKSGGSARCVKESVAYRNRLAAYQAASKKAQEPTPSDVLPNRRDRRRKTKGKS